jgi:hypothetical protein
MTSPEILCDGPIRDVPYPNIIVIACRKHTIPFLRYFQTKQRGTMGEGVDVTAVM